MTALRLIQGGAQTSPLPACQICAIPHGHDCGVLAGHLAWMTERGLAATTTANRESQIRLLARQLPVPVLAATRDDLARWRTSLRLEPGGVCNAVTHVNQFYEWAIARAWTASNPAAGLPVPKRPRRYPRPIADDALFAAVAAAGQPVRAWLVLAGWSGLRARECARLLAANVRLDGPEPYLLVDSEAAKGGRERIVPVSPFVAAELRAHGIPATGYVFGPVAPHGVSHRANGFLHGCGIPDTFHSLRHRALTRAYQATRDIRAVQSLAGHSRVDSTAIYTAFADGAVRAAAEAIPVPPG